MPSQEERIFSEFCGRIISGASDLYTNKKISDYKVTSAWTQVYGSRTEEWTGQLNIYAYLFRSIGFEVNEIEVRLHLSGLVADQSSFECGLPTTAHGESCR